MRADESRTDVRRAFAHHELTNENIYQCPVCGCRDGRITGTEAGRRYVNHEPYRYVDIILLCNGCKEQQRISICEKIPHGQSVLEMVGVTE